jgi:flagellar motor switch protein FliN/FliY
MIRAILLEGGLVIDGSGTAPLAAENKIDQSELDRFTAELGAPANAASPTATITGDGSVVDDPIAAAMAAAIAGEAEDAADPVVLNTGGIATSADDARPFSAPDFGSPADLDHSASIELLDDVKLDVKIELGRTDMYIEDVLHLGVGSVVELDKLAGDPVDICVNERLIARGEVLVLNDNFCVRINDIHSPIPELDGV